MFIAVFATFWVRIISVISALTLMQTGPWKIVDTSSLHLEERFMQGWNGCFKHPGDDYYTVDVMEENNV
jgi:hypothetical protein